MDNDDVTDLNCAKCNRLFETNPLRLPCGNVLCKSHVINNNNKVRCDFCFFKIHAIKKINVDKKLMKKLNLHNFDKNYKLILEHIKELTTLLSRPYIQIHDYFGDFINKIDIQMVNASIHLGNVEHYEAIILSLDEIEQKCLERLDKLQSTHFVEIETQNLIYQQVYDSDQITNSLISKYKSNEQILNQKLTTLKYELVNSNQIKLCIDEGLKKLTEGLIFDHLINIERFKVGYFNLVCAGTLRH